MESQDGRRWKKEHMEGSVAHHSQERVRKKRGGQGEKEDDKYWG